MKQEYAYELWNTHIEKWITFLQNAKDLSEEDGDRVRLHRQLKTLHDVKYGVVASPSLFYAFIHPEGIRHKEKKDLDHFYNESLNPKQRKAVNTALHTDNVSIIQGPPGTGKTTVITEICMQILLGSPDSRILICSETHVAVNNVLEKLYEKLTNFNAIRIKNKEVDAAQEIEESSVDTYLEEYYTELLNHNIQTEVVTALKDVFSKKRFQNQLEKSLLLSKRVVGITCNGIGAYNFTPEDIKFDYVIIDEVCKATLPEILMPMSIARKAILVGDPKQLPPLFCKEDAELMKETNTLEIQKYTYIDNLFNRIPTDLKETLNKQFRMKDEIGQIVSDCFYKEEGGLEHGRQIKDPGCVVWANYRSKNKWPVEEGTKIYNYDEIDIVKDILMIESEKTGDEKQEVAVISPYRPMIGRLRKAIRNLNLRNLNIQVDTVDAFQGKDADIVIFCITRNSGTMRFFSDYRRLNVAISRAKNKLWIIGDASYTNKSPILRKVKKYMNEQLFVLNDSV
ncbi:protein kinase family protein [Mycobacteroides abscessus subsp. abscessus]|nr:protein kinase family protein [Mycobacteroides abscessus subsp. abscessus]